MISAAINYSILIATGSYDSDLVLAMINDIVTMLMAIIWLNLIKGNSILDSEPDTEPTTVNLNNEQGMQLTP